MHSSPMMNMNEVNSIRAEQDRAFNRLGGRAPDLDEQREMAEGARRFEDLYSDLELSIPEPGPTERPFNYEIALLRPLQRFSSSFRHTDLGKLARLGAIAGVDAEIIREATAWASDRTRGSRRKPGQLREIKRGAVTDFYGSPLSWMSAHMPPVRLAVEGFMGQKRR